MSIETVFKDFYEHLYDLLSADTELTGATKLNVPTANMRPSFDVDKVPTGNLIDYGWSSSSIDLKRRRAQGTLGLRARSIKNKIHAQEILSRIRYTTTARSITNSGAGKVVVHLFKELPNTDDEVSVQDDNRYIVAASFNVRLVAKG